MKLLLCSDVCLGADCTEKLSVALSQKWRKERANKFENLVDRAAMNNAEYIVLTGRLFGEDRVPESVIDELFSAVKEDEHIKVVSCLNKKEYGRIFYRNDVPDNMFLVCAESGSENNEQSDEVRIDDNVTIRTGNGRIELLLMGNEPIVLNEDENGIYRTTVHGDSIIVPCFEPVGFEDAVSNQFGYAVIEWSQDTIDDCQVIANRKYNFESAEIKILPVDTQGEILNKINKEVAKRQYDTFLRITLSGKSPFGMILNSDALAKKLCERMFFVEVYDNSVMDIDEADFENDISLRSEFVRLALHDDTLSESERNKIISCGWNALGGKEVSR